MPVAKRSQFGQRVLAISAVTWFALLAFAFVIPAFNASGRRSMSPAQRQIKKIQLALAVYEHKHGCFPYDDRGDKFALYKLHDLIDAAAFQVGGSASVSPSWDHDTQRLRGGNVEFLNRQDLNSTGSQLVLVVQPQPSSTSTYVAFADFRFDYPTFSSVPDRRILGSFRTLDGLYVVGANLYRDLATTHIVAGHSWSTTEHSDIGLVSARVAGRDMRYTFTRGRIRRCTIVTPAGTIAEKFTTDEFGRITNVARTPPNWRGILAGDVTEPSDGRGAAETK